MKNFSSRKFLLSVAAFLASIGGSITGVVTDNQALTIAGAVCTMLSAAIYAALEAYVDGKAVVASETTNETKTTETVAVKTTNK